MLLYPNFQNYYCLLAFLEQLDRNARTHDSFVI